MVSLTWLPGLFSDRHGHGWQSQGYWLVATNKTSALLAYLLWNGVPYWWGHCLASFVTPGSSSFAVPPALAAP